MVRDRHPRRDFNMRNSKSVLEEVIGGLHLQESRDEIRSMALILLENVLGLSATDVMTGKMVTITDSVSRKLDEFLKRLNENEPVQYVVGEAFFFNRRFKVDRSVLIPRPETEELVRTVLTWAHGSATAKSLRVLDIGTGSGCIPITLALELKTAEIYALDVSADALAIAQKNADDYGVKVNFIHHDIIQNALAIKSLDAIVSNPPYVLDEEKAQMKSNVRDYEPHIALFVPDDDPLKFYRRIVREAATTLGDNGLLAMEINERFGEEVVGLLVSSGFSQTRLEKDMAGKPRIVSGIKTTA